MKTRAYLVAIIGLILLSALYYKSKHLNVQKSTNSIEMQAATESDHSPKSSDLESQESQDQAHDDAEDHNHDHAQDSSALDETMLANERFYTEKEIADMTRVDFEALLIETENKLPTISEIRKLPPEALHHTPLPIIKAGRELGLIKEILSVHDDFELEAQEFYLKCAQHNERPTPVRAMCLTNLIEINKKRGIDTNLKQYPSQIVDLAKMITDV